jgi:hypothetical protein
MPAGHGKSGGRTVTLEGEETRYQLSAEEQVHMLRRLMLYWDGQWFLKAVDAFGLDAAVDLNARVRASFGRIEMRLLLKAVGMTSAADLPDAMRLIDLYTQTFLGKAIQAEFVAVEKHRSQVNVRRCAAYEGAKLAALPRDDQACVACEGLWSAWLAILLPGAQINVDCSLCQGKGDPMCSFFFALSDGPQPAKLETEETQTGDSEGASLAPSVAPDQIDVRRTTDVYRQGL